ncbi:MAG: molybdopterin-dependent oxidoreductase [Coriobacteriaceae bacterium]|jgi:molybdopterin-containing oxidoreductase family molybdopterin binding subunit|nr:molybdopterin-dependent oxidoreductase [Coriobacteriaceae bacterium]
MGERKTAVRAGFGRREFVKGLAATAGLAAIGQGAYGCASPALEKEEAPKPAAQAPEEQVYQGLCHTICGGAACFNVHVRDGKIVKTSYKPDPQNPEYGHICARGLLHAQHTYAPERIQYPMRRVEGTERGAGQWERITWDEAIDEICTRWKGYIAEFGPHSIGFCFGSGSTLMNQYVWTRLHYSLGSTQWVVYDCMASLNVGKDVFGRSLFLVGNDGYDILNSKYLVFWGCNRTEAGFEQMPLIWQAIEKGAKVIVVDPMFSDMASKADIYIPIRPTTDGVLAMAMTKYIIEQGLADTDYLIKNTVGPLLVKDDGYTYVHAADIGVELEPTTDPATGAPVVPFGNPSTGAPVPPKDEFGRSIDYVVADAQGNLGTVNAIANPMLEGSFEVNGVQCKTAYTLLKERVAEWTLERASAICDIPVETIVEFTKMYAEGPTYLGLGFGVDRYCNGGANTHCIYAMAIAAGQVGKPGAGVGCNNGGNGVFRPDDIRTDFTATWFTPDSVYTGIMTPINYLPEALATGMYNGEPITVKSILTYCTNHLATSPDRNEILRDQSKIEFLIHVDTFMTEACQYVDMVLPLPYWFEYETIGSKSRFNEKAIEPLFETKTDVEICCAIAKGLGLSGYDIDEASYNQMYYETDSCKAAGWGWDRIKEEKAYYNPSPHVPYIYGNVDYGTAWMTPSGRATFLIENPENYFDFTKPIDKRVDALPHVKTPNEAWPETIDVLEKNPVADKYPLFILSTHDRLKAHTIWSKCPQLVELKPEPTVSINPLDAGSRGIKEGDYVRVFNDRGSMVARAHFDAASRPGVLRTEHGWWSDQHKAGEKINALTSSKIDHHWPALEHFDLLCQVEKYDLKEGN